MCKHVVSLFNKIESKLPPPQKPSPVSQRKK
jgi:hypothetical protein